MNKQKKLNTLTLSGLIIGPVLGSSVILLPPLLYNHFGNFALIIWLVICLLGLAFALVFGRLSILYPGDGGVSLATKVALGKKYQFLTSFYLISAVIFGPLVVLLIAAQFIQDHFVILVGIDPIFIALGVYALTYLMLLVRIDFLGKLMLIVTSTITILFIVSSIITLSEIEQFSFLLPRLDVAEIGHGFLIAFWAIVGWEVIGNYSNDIEDSKTITRAVIFSAVMVAVIYFLLATAITFGDFEQSRNNTKPFKLVWLIEKLFGDFSSLLLAIIAPILCIGTLILFVGGVARLISSFKIHPYLSKHLSSGSPVGALNILGLIHLFILALVYWGVFNISNLIAFADGFFIANAIIGLVTAIVLFDNGFLRYSAFVLVALFFTIMLFSNIYILGVIIGLFLIVYLKDNFLK